MTQEKLKWKFTLSLKTSILVIIAFSCQLIPQSDYQELSKIVETHYKYSLKDFNTVVILEENSCIACNKTYASWIENNIKDSILLVVAATGKQYDVDIFRNLDMGKVIFDYSNKIKKQGMLKTSGAIFIRNSNIDTIIPLNNSQSLSEKMEFIEEKINGREFLLNR